MERGEPRKVTCSCGQTTTLNLIAAGYVPLDPRWKFRTVAEADLYERSSGRDIAPGWYRGEPDHEPAILRRPAARGGEYD